MADKDKLIDALRNSVAQNKLFVITGAGISTAIKKKDGAKLPSWGMLIQNLLARAESAGISFTDNDIDLIERLIPKDFLNDVHGDAYIEASQIVENRVGDGGEFTNWIREETTGDQGFYGNYHRYIERIKPRGIATFNYDNGHENAFLVEGTPYEVVLYNEDEKLIGHINGGFSGNTLILKAHGCISNNESIVLTSSSYKKLLNDHRTYRALIQHVLSRFTVLIVGFSLRDRDFDQMLDTIEKDFGSSVQNHIAIIKHDAESKDTDKGRQRKLAISNYAVLEARYGLKVLSTESHDESERLLESLSIKPGSWITNLAERIISTDTKIRSISRKEMLKMSDIGKEQLCELLIEQAHTGNVDLEVRSEQLYSIGLLKQNKSKVLDLFLSECETQADKAIINKADIVGHIECIAHSLVALRLFSVTTSTELESIRNRLVGDNLIQKLSELDNELSHKGGNPRLVNYARAAYSEIVARSVNISA